MSYQDLLRDEVIRLRGYLEVEPTSDAFASQLVRGQVARRLHNVEDEILAVSARRLDVKLVHRSEPRSHRLSTAVLGVLLTRLQTSINYMRWALEAGPHVAGNLPPSIMRSASMDAVALSPGSFVIRLEKSELEMSEFYEGSISVLFDLIDAAQSDDFGESIEESVAELGRESVVRLEKLFRRVGKEDLSFGLTWHQEEAREAELDPSHATLLAKWLARATPEIEQVVLVGLLKMADSDTRRFAFETGDGVRYEGKSEVDLAHVEIEGTYQATLVIVTTTSRVTEGKTERVRLLDLTRI